MPPEFKGVRDTDPPLRRAGVPPAEGQPADGGLRARSLTDSDDIYSEYHGRRKESSSSFGRVAGVVIGLAVVVGIGWYMWSSGALTPAGSADGAPQLVKANPDPYKVKPDNPGGMQVENQDKLVYDRVAKGEAPPRVENLLPGPEEPKAPPKPAAPELAPEPAKPEPAPAETAKAEAPKPEAAKPEPAKPEPAKLEPAEAAKPAPKPEPAKEPAKDVAKAEPPKPAEPAKPEEDDLAAAVLAATGGRQAATGPIATAPAKPAAESPSAPAETPAPAQVAAAPPVAAVPPAALAGAFQIQLASARSEQGAMAEWNRIVGKNKDALAGLTPTVARVDLGEKGVFYRLRAGPLADKAAADALCGALGAQNVGCIVVRP